MADPTFIEQALSGKLFTEINGGLQCVAANLALQKKLEDTEKLLAQANIHIGELNAKITELNMQIEELT